MLGRYRIHLLIAVALLLAWVNWRAPAVVNVVNATERGASLSTVASTDFAPSPLAQRSSNFQLPEQLKRPVLQSARNDPFVLPVPRPPVIAKLAPPPPLQMTPPSPPPAPMAPPVNLRYAGRMMTPDGRHVVYVAYGETSLAITAGQSLPNGYRVDAITSRAVELSYPPLNTTAQLELPEPPRYEIR